MTTARVNEILGYYAGENPGVLTNIARILMHGRLGGTGRVVILPVDQGNEHGPDRSFSANPAGYDPNYHFQLAVDAGLSAFAAPLGLLRVGAARFAGQVPLILKTNGANLLSSNKDQGVYASVRNALELGCVGIGFTIYPGSEDQYEMMEELRDLAEEARACGLAVVVWSYPRGGDLKKEGETALDVTAYAAHLAAELGAHVIKVKPPSGVIYQKDKDTQNAFEGNNWENSSLSERVAHVVRAAFAGRRIVIFSGGPAKSDFEVLDEIGQIALGGAFGSIIGRNSFQRKHNDAIEFLNTVMGIYEGAAKAGVAS